MLYSMPVWGRVQHQRPTPCRACCSALPARHQPIPKLRPAQVSSQCCGSTNIDSQTTTASFDYQLQQLSDWQTIFGSCYVPSSARDASNLAAWAHWARRAAKKGQLTSDQQQQLDSLGFVWKPDVVDAKWHHHYHHLRCLLHSGSITLEQLQHYHEQQQQQEYCEQDPGVQHHSEQEQQQQQPWKQEQEQHQQHTQDLQELSAWLARQVVLYGKLKLTPVKVQLLRKLGVKLQRQSGLTRNNLHPLLKGQDATTYQRRPIIVDVVTRTGKTTVAKLIAQYDQWQQQQQRDNPQQQQQQFYIDDLDIAFIYRLAELQRWRKKYGSCYVPTGVFDHQQLAEWVQQVRQVKRAAAAESQQSAAAAAGDGQSQAISSSSSSSALTDSSSIASDDESGQQQQQQQQRRVLLISSAAAVPKDLQTWHLEELAASGFVWKPSRDDEAWHEQYHRLRHFKHLHHNLKLHSADIVRDRQSATSSGSGSSSTSSSISSVGDDWAGLAEWLEQQQQLLALSAWGVTHVADDSSQLSAGNVTGCRRPLSKVQIRLLKNLGVQPSTVG